MEILTKQSPTLRWLYKDDLNILDPIIKARGWIALNHDQSAALCAFDEEERLLAFSIIQLVPYLGPHFVDLSYRGTGLSKQMADGIAEYLTEAGARGAMLIAESPFTERLAQHYEMTKIDFPIYFKRDIT